MTARVDAATPDWAAGQRLLWRARDGDAAAARELVAVHSAGIYRLAARMLADPVEAEDVTQQTFLALWERGDQFRGQSSVGTWLHRIAANLCLDRLRRKGSRWLSLDEELAETLPEPADGPSEHLERQQSAEGLHASLALLPPRQRTAVVLWAWHDAGPAELGEVLGINANAASQLLHRAQTQLKRIMQGEQHAEVR